MFENMQKLGLGAWAIGGEMWGGGAPMGYAGGSDEQSRAVLHAAYEAGLRYIDTAAAYGAGHSETLIGEELSGKDDLVISTKVGFDITPNSREVTGADASAAAITSGLDASRTRLKRDCIDLVFLHLNSLEHDQAKEVFETLEGLRDKGWLKAYGWSTDYPDRATTFADMPGYQATQHAMNVYYDAPSLMAKLEASQVWSVNRSPLAMGLLTGKFGADSQLSGDIRSNDFDWLPYFKGGKPNTEHLEMLGQVRELLTSGGRTLAQGSLAWLWARSPLCLPIAGAKTVAQVEENVRALEFGPLDQDTFQAVEAAIIRPPEGEARDR